MVEYYPKRLGMVTMLTSLALAHIDFVKRQTTPANSNRQYALSVNSNICHTVHPSHSNGHQLAHPNMKVERCVSSFFIFFLENNNKRFTTVDITLCATSGSVNQH